MNKFEFIEQLRDYLGKLQTISKEITSMDVPGLLLVREDLGIRRPKKKNEDIVHGQKHQQNQMTNRVTQPDNEIASDTPRVRPAYSAWLPERII